jgi:hypothetical protein
MAMSWPKRRIWAYETSPRRRFDRVGRTLLRPVMLALSQGKVSHFFDYWNEPMPAGALGLAIRGAPAAFRKRTGLDELRMSLGGWQQGLVVAPWSKQPWQFGYELGDGRLRRCRLVLEGPVRVLRGPGDWRFVGLSALDGSPIQLQVLGAFQRRSEAWARRWPLV